MIRNWQEDIGARMLDHLAPQHAHALLAGASGLRHVVGDDEDQRLDGLDELVQVHAQAAEVARQVGVKESTLPQERVESAPASTKRGMRNRRYLLFRIVRLEC